MISRNAQRLIHVTRPHAQVLRPVPAAAISPKSEIRNPKSEICNAHRRGLSLVELLVSLAITAMLLTATMVAIDASFQAYAAAAESASTQTATRMVTHRLLTLIRTSTAHGPLEPDPDGDDIVESDYIELVDPRGDFVLVEYRADTQELWVTTTPYGSTTATAQPLLGGVTACTFYTHRRMDEYGVLVLERGSMDLTIEPDPDTTLSLESGSGESIRVIASTMPRKLN